MSQIKVVNYILIMLVNVPYFATLYKKKNLRQVYFGVDISGIIDIIKSKTE